ncbi:Fe-S cluster assembly protein SufD [Puteibacter caeruleilacunae]|nr:Fe-S cluster assembly protein SufD [Puteibacter caeruleilacunae]
MTTETKKYSATEDLAGLYTSNIALFESGSPEFMNAARKPAMEEFLRQGIPTRKQENYKYSDLQEIFNRDYHVYPSYVAREMQLNQVFKCDVPELDTNLVLIVNGWYYHQNKELNLPEGVIIDSLSKIASEKPELVEKYYSKLAKTNEDPLAALNTMLAKDGLFIYIPDGVVIEKPIQVINLLHSKEDSFATQRNLFVAGKNSQAKVVFCDHTLTSHHFLSNNLTEVFIEENANFDLYNLQNQHNQSGNLCSVFVSQERSSTSVVNTASLHGGLVRNNLKVELKGEYAEANLFGIALADSDQHIDSFTYVDHMVANCRSNQIFKNVLDEQATGGFTGRIHVQRDAQQTNAFQRNSNVLIHDDARMRTKPQLVIDADDVKCSHGATVGRIDEEALFYLKSRGINDKEARLMLMLAFTHEVIQEIRIDALRERLDDLVEKRFRGEISHCHNCMYHCC